MDINKLNNLSSNEAPTKDKQASIKPELEQKKQTEFVGSQASQAAKAYSAPQINNSKNINFEGKYEKIVETIKTTNCPSKVHLSFDEVSHIIEHMGYRIKIGKGSHCTVDIPNARPLTIVRPHGDHNSVDPGTIKDLKILLSNKYTCWYF